MNKECKHEFEWYHGNLQISGVIKPSKFEMCEKCNLMKNVEDLELNSKVRI